MSRDFVIMEGDFPFWRGFIVEEWKRLPVRTLLLSQAPGLWRRSDWTEVQPLPVSEGAAGGAVLDVARLREIVGRFGAPSGACTMLEPAVGRTLEVQRALGLPELSRLEPRALRNKGEMVRVMERAGLAVPKTVAGTSAEDVAARARRDLPLPVVVKPSELAGKAGVRLVREDQALDDAVRAALAETLPFEIDGAPTSVVGIFGCEQGVLVQEYVEGPELSIEGYASCGRPVVLAVTEKIHSGPPLFEELGHLQPARLGDREERAVREYAEAAVEAFQLMHGAFHLEVRMASRGPVMMEINCRIGGDMIGRLLELRSGLNAGELLLRLAAGERVEPPPRWLGAAGVRMATVAEGGRVRALRAPALRHDRELAAFESGPGDVVHAPKPGGVTRVGYMIAVGDDVAAVEARLAQMAAETRVDLEPASG